MTAVLALVAAQCFVLDDLTPGWKRIELPADAPRLAASASVSQFRSDEPVTVLDDDLGKLLAGTTRTLGRATFEFSLPAATQRFAVEFARPLDGAKVDVEAVLRRGVLRLLDEKRIGGKEIALELPTEEPATLRLTVHHHLRDAPALAAARGWRHGLPRALGLPPDLVRDRALYVLAPAGGVTLCDQPSAAWSVKAAEMNDATIVKASLRRKEEARSALAR